MVSIRIEKSKITGCIRCPSSKSYSHRAIAIASLAKGQSMIKNVLLSRDTLATVSACKALGAIIKHEDSTLWIEGKQSFSAPENVVNAENSGTTIRIMTSVSALVKKGFTVLTGDESLRKRPMQPLLDALVKLGVQCYSTKLDGTAPLIVRGGGIKGGTAVIEGRISSQFVSSLLISSTYADSETVIRIVGKQVSKPYIECTLAAMNTFGVTIDTEPDFSEYHIRRQDYRPSIFDVPSDFSSAALILSAGIVSGEELTIKHLNFNLPQADSKILDIIRTMGGKIKVDKQKGEVIVYGSGPLEGGNFDLSDTPDLLPVVSVLALKATSPVKISGIAHTRFKETDRVAHIATEFKKLGTTIKEQENELLIVPPKFLKNASLEAFNDHRLFMAFTIASMMTENSLVAGAESVDVSYPNFIKDMMALGTRIKHMPDRE